MSRGQILVVDDEVSILNTLKKALSLEGYLVDVAGGAGIAERKIREGSHDLVLMDVALPDGDGVEVLGRLRAAGIQIPVVMMSGRGSASSPLMPGSMRSRRIASGARCSASLNPSSAEPASRTA